MRGAFDSSTDEAAQLLQLTPAMELFKPSRPGVFAGTMIGLLAVARSICALGREHFIWPAFGWVRFGDVSPSYRFL